MAQAVSLMAMAAAGDHAAQADLRDEFLAEAERAAKGASAFLAPSADLMVGAELLARLAADHPEGLLDDSFVLAAILLTRVSLCRPVPALETYADVMEDEARGLINRLLEADSRFLCPVAALLQDRADAGDEWAAKALTELVDALPADEATALLADVRDLDLSGSPSAFLAGGVLTDDLPAIHLEPRPAPQ